MDDKLLPEAKVLWYPDTPEITEGDEEWYKEIPGIAEEEEAEAQDLSEADDAPIVAERGQARLKDAFQKPYAYMTLLSALICVVIWAGIQTEADMTTWPQLEKWGYFSYTAILSGKYWGLITSNFFHQDALHIFFNLYWFLMLGSKIEKESGRTTFLLLVLTACLVSSGAELLFHGQTGIGISGVVYAFVGFMLVCSRKLDAYRNYLSKRDYKWLLIWLVACLVLTYSGRMNIANAAHFGGFFWGMLFAAAWLTREQVVIARLAQAALLALSLLPLFWAPWLQDWLLIKGAQAYEDDNHTQAEIYFKQVVEKGTENSAVYSLLAEIAEEKGNLDEALANYQHTDSLKPSTEAKLQITKIYLTQKKYDEALAVAQAYLAENPDYSLMNQLAGAIYFDKKKFPQAIACYTKALKQSPKDLSILSSLGSAHRKVKNFEQAAFFDKLVIELDPGNAAAQAELIYTLVEQKKVLEAVQTCQAALKKKPSDPDLLLALGYLYLEQNNPVQAIELYLKQLTKKELAPKYQMSAHYNLACAYIRQENKESALSHLKQAIALRPEFKAQARTDDDFKSLRNEAEFKRLTS